MSDPVVQKLIDLYLERSSVGVQKYGKTLERKDLSLIEWLYHALFEAMDLSLYLLRVIVEFENNAGE